VLEFLVLLGVSDTVFVAGRELDVAGGKLGVVDAAAPE
jgi:hypothetical protein